MKIPKGKYIGDTTKTLWHEAAAQLSLQYGIFIDVIFKYGQTVYDVEEICFAIDEKEFENLQDLKKALENKFLL